MDPTAWRHKPWTDLEVAVHIDSPATVAGGFTIHCFKFRYVFFLLLCISSLQPVQRHSVTPSPLCIRVSSRDSGWKERKRGFSMHLLSGYGLAWCVGMRWQDGGTCKLVLSQFGTCVYFGGHRLAYSLLDWDPLLFYCAAHLLKRCKV